MAFEIDQDKLMELAAQKLADDVYDESEISGAARELISKKVDKLWADQAEALVQAQVVAAINDGFDKEYHRIDQYGRPDGDKTTIRKELDNLIASYWSQDVDSKGRASSGYGTTSRAEWMMVQICGDDFSEHMKQSVVNATAGLKDGLRKHLKKKTDGMLNDLFRVKSTGDKEAS